MAARAREGDVDAYQQLVERYQGVAHRLAYLITRSSADADDATQDAFVKAYYALARFRSGAAFRPWLLRIVANEARNRRRSAGRRARLDLRLTGDQPIPPPGPAAAAVMAEQRRLLLEAVDRLPERERLAVSYRFFLGLSEAEMAEVMNCAPGTVKSRLARAMTRMRRTLSPELLEEDRDG